MKGRLSLNITQKVTPYLEFGDTRECVISDEIAARALDETKEVRGMILFEDGSKLMGSRREVYLEDPIFKVGNMVVKAIGFSPYEYFSKPSMD